MPAYFDLERIITESKLTKQQVEAIQQEIRKEFPEDELMFELHFMRAIKAEAESRKSRPGTTSSTRFGTTRISRENG